MKIQRCFAMCCALFLLIVDLLPNCAAAEEKKKGDNKYVCDESNPASLCNAGNTCGPSCTVDVKRTSYSSSVTPNIPGAKGNQLFCIKAGTTVTWQAPSKNTGFFIDFGPNSPFDPPDAITGGSAKSASVVAKTPGCYKYGFQASNSTAIYGMSKASQAELIVISGK
jgi:hypothetical protein